jgi:hypothetical protein
MDAVADPGLRLSTLVMLFSIVAGIRLIRVGLPGAAGRWSSISGAALIAVSLAREVPRFLERPAQVITCEEPPAQGPRVDAAIRDASWSDIANQPVCAKVPPSPPPSRSSARAAPG